MSCGGVTKCQLLDACGPAGSAGALEREARTHSQQAWAGVATDWRGGAQASKAQKGCACGIGLFSWLLSPPSAFCAPSPLGDLETGQPPDFNLESAILGPSLTCGLQSWSLLSSLHIYWLYQVECSEDEVRETASGVIT